MPKRIDCRGKVLKLDRTLIMGILNITQDSFSDGGLSLSKESALKNALKMISDGADIIDIGGESSRPGSEPVSAKEEIRRVLPVIKELRKKSDAIISIDTYKPEVADKCLKAGAGIINDITGLTNPYMRKIAAKHKALVIIMHMQGNPKTMQVNPHYKDVVNEIIMFFRKQISLAEKEGIKEIIIDPGFGFGKTVENNIEILRRLREFTVLKKPILVGVSRKSFLGAITGLPVNQRLEATITANTIAILNKADIIRVHDVKQCKQSANITDMIRYKELK